MTLRYIAIIAFAALFFLPGCYWDRMTFNYDDDEKVKDIHSKDTAIIGVSGQDDEAERIRRARLEELVNETDSEYLINPGDRIEIRVYGHDDLGMTTKVSPDGCIGLVFIGQLKISGLSIADTAAEIERGLAPYVKHPVVGVTVQEIASDTVTISGACARPGLFSVNATTRLADVYAMAGGSAERLFNGADVDVADLAHSVIVRNGEILPVDFRQAIDAGDPLNNILVHRGDYIHIAQRMESSITICGEVGHPHRRLYEEGLGLVELLATSGWVEESHWSHVIIIRDSLGDPKMYKVDLDGILAGKCANVRLEPNDIIYVPKDNLAEYNVFVRKLIPSAQLFNLIFSDKLSTSNAHKGSVSSSSSSKK